MLNQYRKEGVTIVFVSHDLGAVRRFCDRTLLLHKGTQVALGNTGDVIDKYVYGGNESPDPALSENEQAEGGEKPETKTRWGDKAVEIVNVEFYDKFGNLSSRFNSFDPVTIRIFYEAHEKVLDPVFGIALYSEKGDNLFGTNTELKDFTMDSIKGNGHIDLVIDRLPILTGRFLLTVAVHSHDHKPYDWHDKLYSFDVMPTSLDAGLFEIPCSWRL